MKTATVATGVQDWPGGRLAIKRGSGAEQLDFDEMEIASPVGDDDALLALNLRNLPALIRGRRNW